eukprot:m.9546 g.9546  ORF g.9546 m.9546 type:complete len:115 (+) comp21420_c0_seq2:61-405(+)
MVDDSQQVEQRHIIVIKDRVASSGGDVLTFGITLLNADDVEVEGIYSDIPRSTNGDKFAKICYKWMNKEVAAATIGKLCSALNARSKRRKRQGTFGLKCRDFSLLTCLREAHFL